MANPASSLTLNEVLDCGIIGVGERGEVVGRLILMRAYDRAVQSANSMDHNPIFFSLLTEFINCLFSPREANKVLNSVSDVARNGEKSLELGEEFKKACIRFTHFERLHDGSVVSNMGCIAGITRCTAYIAMRGQKQVDQLSWTQTGLDQTCFGRRT